MSLLQAKGLCCAYPATGRLFAKVDFDVDAGDRIALVGPNGAGKTSLLRILAGDQRPDEGQIVRRRGLTWAYFSQEGRSATEAHPEERERTLRGLGFDTADVERPVEWMSAGQRGKWFLATCLESGADLLLLDEPTNHLDARAQEWLWQFLVRRQTTCVFVSHDEDFLRRVSTRTFEIRRGNFQAFGGGYELYQQQRSEQLAREWEGYESQQKQIAAWERAAAKRDTLAAKVAAAPPGAKLSHDFYRRKAAKVARTGRILREREMMLEPVDKPWEEAAIPQLDFRNTPRAGGVPVAVEQLSKSFGDHRVIRGLDWFCRRGERWAVVGPNGCGKTTLFRLLLGLEKPDAGVIRFGHQVQLGYYAQEAENLDPQATPVEICREVCGDLTWIRTLLACLKLPRDYAGVPMRQLSGGERSKVALARLLVSGANVLLLDEPTNHLEWEARQALVGTLRQFPGTLLFTSHDAAFVDALATARLALG
jgi:ATPase subunit of ABC transporter with duplicated ATPase domains